MPRKERNIFKRKDGYFEARYFKEYNVDGKAKYGSVYAKTYTEVKEKLKSVSEISDSATTKQDTVKGVATAYLKSIKSVIKPSTYALYNRYLSKHISPFFGNMKCVGVTQKLIKKFIDKKLDGGLKISTAKSIFTFLKSAVTESGISIPKNAFDIEFPKNTAKEVEALSLGEQKKLETAAKYSDSANYAGITLCLYTGIRIGELCALKWADIDFERGILHVRRTIQRIKDESESRDKTKLVFMPPKSLSSIRAIPIPEFIVNTLRKHKTENGGAFVISRNDNPVEPRTVQYRFKKLLKTAEIEPKNYHVLRHTFAVRALENGFDIKTLSEILGHANASITLNIYAHSMLEHKRNCMESLASKLT